MPCRPMSDLPFLQRLAAIALQLGIVVAVVGLGMSATGDLGLSADAALLGLVSAALGYGLISSPA